ncbi:DUF3667 domain-containing protein [Chromobacterium sphagni]|uniref:DUF3667 domain-containing protein n=1 Tax=Chromobacterium sphagni TaxID=1903179 RepID=A0ABX3CCX1_9NEIS|nr:DUF3667 domain-containing protein [Chromobacterium sphagni]OHX19875.1 hypothetical protein BI344_16175 [Chromobacterium sphagni]
MCPRQSSSSGHCANCNHPVSGRFCPECGQKTHIKIPTLWEFIHEYLHHHVSMESALTRSLWLLAAQPGRLTEEYLLGRRQRYVKPLQLYLTISFFFFVLLGLAGGAMVYFDKSDASPQTASLSKAVASDPEVRAAFGGDSSQDSVILSTGNQLSDLWLKRWGDHLGKEVKRFREQPEEANAELLHSLRGHAPFVLFSLMPLFALLLRLAYFGRHRVYGMHLVFTLHFHAWLFLVLCLGFVLTAVSAWLFFAGTPVYLWLAQRRVYGGGKFALALRTLGLLLIYTVLVCLGMVVLVSL